MLTFFSADLITGEIRDELPLRVGQDLSRYLMDVGSGTLELPIRDPACPDDWLDHTLPWRTLLVAVDERAQVVWAGIPTRRIRNPAEPIVEMSCVTVEGYLRHRHVPTRSWRVADQTSGIARGLVEIANNRGIGLEFDTPHSVVNRDREYHEDEGATVLTRLQELARVVNGFEWTIDVDWTDSNQTSFTKTFRTGYPHIGRVTTRPNAVFELPGGIIDATVEESWAEGDAATHVIAVGDGEGESKTMSTPVIDTTREGTGWPRLEVRESFSSVTRQDTINAHAQAVAGQVFGGQEVITFSARSDVPPRFGQEWNLGDSARVEIRTDTVNVEAIMRIIGWTLADTENAVEPVLARVGGGNG